MTQALHRFLRRGLEQAKQDFIDGAYINKDGMWQTSMQQADVIGRCTTAQTILDLEANQLGVEDEE